MVKLISDHYSYGELLIRSISCGAELGTQPSKVTKPDFSTKIISVMNASGNAAQDMATHIHLCHWV